MLISAALAAFLPTLALAQGNSCVAPLGTIKSDLAGLYDTSTYVVYGKLQRSIVPVNQPLVRPEPSHIVLSCVLKAPTNETAQLVGKTFGVQGFVNQAGANGTKQCYETFYDHERLYFLKGKTSDGKGFELLNNMTYMQSSQKVDDWVWFDGKKRNAMITTDQCSLNWMNSCKVDDSFKASSVDKLIEKSTYAVYGELIPDVPRGTDGTRVGPGAGTNANEQVRLLLKPGCILKAPKEVNRTELFAAKTWTLKGFSTNIAGSNITGNEAELCYMFGRYTLKPALYFLQRLGNGTDFTLDLGLERQGAIRLFDMPKKSTDWTGLSAEDRLKMVGDQCPITTKTIKQPRTVKSQSHMFSLFLYWLMHVYFKVL